MNKDPEISREQAHALAEMAGLDLPPERLATLASSLSTYLARARRLRTIDPRNHEPPVITYDDEAVE